MANNTSVFAIKRFPIDHYVFLHKFPISRNSPWSIWIKCERYFRYSAIYDALNQICSVVFTMHLFWIQVALLLMIRNVLYCSEGSFLSFFFWKKSGGDICCTGSKLDVYLLFLLWSELEMHAGCAPKPKVFSAGKNKHRKNFEGKIKPI